MFRVPNKQPTPPFLCDCVCALSCHARTLHKLSILCVTHRRRRVEQRYSILRAQARALGVVAPTPSARFSLSRVLHSPSQIVTVSSRDTRTQGAEAAQSIAGAGCTPRTGLYKRFFHFEAFVHESIILALLPPTCTAHTIVILLHDYCAIYDPLLDPPFVCHTPYNIGNGNPSV